MLCYPLCDQTWIVCWEKTKQHMGFQISNTKNWEEEHIKVFLAVEGDSYSATPAKEKEKTNILLYVYFHWIPKNVLLFYPNTTLNDSHTFSITSLTKDKSWICLPQMLCFQEFFIENFNSKELVTKTYFRLPNWN